MNFSDFTNPGRSTIARSNFYNSLELLFAENPIEYDKNSYSELLRYKSVNAFAARCFFKELLYDTVMVSETFATKLTAKKIQSQQISLRKDQYIDVDTYHTDFDFDINMFDTIQKKEQITNKGIFENLFMQRIEKDSNIKEYLQNVIQKKYVINRNKKLTIIGENGKKSFIRSSIKHKYSCIIRKVTYEEIDNEYKKAIIVYESVLPLEKGDKLCTQTGHKFTAMIIPDDEMPTLNGEKLEMVYNYAIGKRETPSVLIEELSSLYVKEFGLEEFHKIQWKDPWELALEIQKKIPTTEGLLEWKGNTYVVPYGNIRIFRHNHNVSEILKFTTDNNSNKNFNSINSIKLNYLIKLSLKNRGCDRLLSYFQTNLLQSNSYKIFENIKKALTEEIDPEDISTFLISEPLKGTLWNKMKSTGNINTLNIGIESLNYTVFDERIKNTALKGYFIIEIDGESNYVRIPSIATDIFTGHDDKYIVRRITTIINEILSTMKKANAFKLPGKKFNEDINNKLTYLFKNYKEELLKLFVSASQNIISPYIGDCIYGSMSGNTNLKYNEVGIPRHIYRHFIKMNNTFKLSKNKRVMVYTQPFHCDKHLASMKAVPVEGDSIQFNPSIVALFERDFDGDAIYIVIPNQKEAYDDLDKIRIEELLSQDSNYTNSYITKQIQSAAAIMFDDGMDYKLDKTKTKFQQELQILDNHYFDGVSSCFSDMKFATEDGVPKVIWDLETIGPFFNEVWFNGVRKKVYKDFEINAAYNASAVKSQTAYSGAIGLRFINWCLFRDKSVEVGMMFYHFLAQNSLYSKHGKGSEAVKIIDFYNIVKNSNKEWDENKITILLDELIVSMDRIPEEQTTMKTYFIEFLKEMQQYKITADFENAISPLFAITRNSITSKTIKKYILDGKYYY